MTQAVLFDQKGYIHIPSFLDKENCDSYVIEFKKLIDEGKATADEQCPMSFSLGHCALFDSLLEQLTPHIENITNKKLYPTYAYARWYVPGDELKIHTDRPSCEISATITLGMEGNPWPIYMGYDEYKNNFSKCIMYVGDAVIYKGQEMWHWREKYVEGQAQIQVFVHYVDAYGPNAEWRYDKRTQLAHHINTKSIDPGAYVVKEKALSALQCSQLINSLEKNMEQSTDALLSGDVLNKSIRDCKKIQLAIDQGIASTMLGIGIQINRANWNFDITHSSQSEYLRYDKEGHFSTHLDTILSDYKSLNTRKITALLILNNDFEGGRFYLQTGNNKTYPSQNPGDIIFFPSYILHGVEPVTSGIRKTVVTWLEGPYFK